MRRMRQPPQALAADTGFHSRSAAAVVERAVVVSVAGEQSRRVEGRGGGEGGSWRVGSSRSCCVAF
jgi:hypothetical protein